MSKDLLRQLADLKQHPDAGTAHVAVVKEGRARLMTAIHHESSVDFEYSVQGATAFYRWFLHDMISRPMVVGVASFVLLFGGWMTSVNAASASLPGDTLYSFKRAGEYARIRLASSERRAVLHTEFARRRYEELLALQAAPDRQADAAVAMNDFKEQIDLANTNFQRIKEGDETQVLAVATQLDERLEELNAVIGEVNQIEASSADAVTAEEAKASTRKAQEAVVDAIIEKQEGASVEDISTRELERLFSKELNDLRRREAFDLGRLMVITAAIGQLQYENAPTDDALQVINYQITTAGESMNEALNLAAAGGYRSAFAIMREADNSLKAIEQQLAQIELQIMEERARLKAVDEQPEVSEDEVSSNEERVEGIAE